MFRVLEDIDDMTVTLDDLKNEWSEMFDRMEDEMGTLSYEKYMESDYYDPMTYILDTRTGICYKANDFFHEHVRQKLN